MDRSLHFISGLPRSGSTLLCAILRQNPRIHAAMTSPMAAITRALVNEMSPPSQFADFFGDDQRCSMLRGAFASYYDGLSQRPLVFDTNRIWSGNIAMLVELFPTCRIICCVRDIGWIIDSLELMLRRNPLQVSRIFEGTNVQTIYSRAEALMNADAGFIGAAWSHLREAWYSDFASRLLLVSYDGFVRDPAGAMQRLYAALGEPAFAHDFDDVGYDEPDYDAQLGMPGLHRVRPRVDNIERFPAIPPDLFRKFEGNAFWRAKYERPYPPTIIC